MRILVLSKRQYTGKDLLDDRYGRLFELPVQLASMGHDIKAMILSYRRKGEMKRTEAGLEWHSFDLFPSPFRYWRELKRAVEEFRPDVIWASSDAVHAIIGSKLQAIFGIPFVIDLYDDYEAFELDRFPGLRAMYRSACRKADGLSVVSESLAEILRARGSSGTLMKVIGNGVQAGFGQCLDRIDSRKLLDLPLDLKLIGTAGALNASRGIEDLFLAFDLVRSKDPDVRLVIAGPKEGIDKYLSRQQVIDLGTIPHSQIAILFSALNVGVVCNRDSAFGRACHPQKLVEMVASQLPVVAASVGDTGRLLSGYPQSLYVPGDHQMLADRILGHLNSPLLIPYTSVENWNVLASRLENLLKEAKQVASSTY